jgi:hypothetical protein
MTNEMPDVPRALFDDVKAAAQVGRALARAEEPSRAPTASAIERGRRERPDGTVETYERVEF